MRILTPDLHSIYGFRRTTDRFMHLRVCFLWCFLWAVVLPAVELHAETRPEETPVVLPAVIPAPQWEALTADQRIALAPLQSTWDTLGDTRKRKWIAIARNYKQLPTTEQEKMQERMKDWTTLSAKEREQARFNFAQASKISPEKRASQWEAYQALGEDERKALAEKAPPKPKGAAVVVKPTPQNTIQATKPLESTKAPTPRIDPHTLLPLQ